MTFREWQRKQQNWASSCITLNQRSSAGIRVQFQQCSRQPQIFVQLIPNTPPSSAPQMAELKQLTVQSMRRSKPWRPWTTHCHLHAHDAYCLLRHSFALPKLLYTLRTSPSSKSHLLQDFDSLLRNLLGKTASTSAFQTMTRHGPKPPSP